MCVGHTVDTDTSTHKVILQTQSTCVRRISLQVSLRPGKVVPLPWDMVPRLSVILRRQEKISSQMASAVAESGTDCPNPALCLQTEHDLPPAAG